MILIRDFAQSKTRKRFFVRKCPDNHMYSKHLLDYNLTFNLYNKLTIRTLTYVKLNIYFTLVVQITMLAVLAV